MKHTTRRKIMHTPGRPLLISSVMFSGLTFDRIIKDYYITQVDPAKRPKIFGMTASPVDVREDVVKAAK